MSKSLVFVVINIKYSFKMILFYSIVIWLIYFINTLFLSVSTGDTNLIVYFQMRSHFNTTMECFLWKWLHQETLITLTWWPIEWNRWISKISWYSGGPTATPIRLIFSYEKMVLGWFLFTSAWHERCWNLTHETI